MESEDGRAKSIVDGAWKRLLLCDSGMGVAISCSL